MPTEVAMAINLPTPYMQTQEPSHLSTETKSGSITLIYPNGRRQVVNVIVYQTTLEHFAVLYPQKKICRPLGVINLKTTKIERLNEKQAGFRLRQLGFDTPMTLTFLCEQRDLDSWMEAFTSRVHTTLRHQSSLPCVEEDEEI